MSPSLSPVLAVLIVGLSGSVLGCASSPPAAPAGPDRLMAPPSAADSAAATAVLDEIGRLSPDLFDADTFTGDNGVTLRYRLLSPLDPEPGRRYPLVVVFHGAGEIGTDNLAHLDLFPKTWARPEIRRQFPAYVLAPQMPERSALYSGPAGEPDRTSRPGPPLSAALDLIDALRDRLPIDDRRIYGIGFSMGSSTAWNVLARRPDLFAAAIPIAGVPNRSAVAETARTPLWVIHGNADTANPIDQDRAMVEALRARPGADVRFWEYDRMGHGVPIELLAGDAFMEWLFAHHQ